MGWLSKLVTKAAPKVLKAVVVGGSKTERDMLKVAIEKPVFQPVFQKFGDSVETGAKIAVAIAAGALTAGVGSAGILGAGGAGVAGSAGIGTTGIGAILSKVIPKSNGEMSLLGNLTKGVFDTVKPALGDLAKSALGGLLSGVLNKNTGVAMPPITMGSGTSTGSSTSTTKTTTSANWYEQNKSWINPLGIGIGILTVVIALVKMIFGRGRR